ncbi:glycosyltransferase family 2 protein [Beggiatoa leptomitoformis]|uniref:Glycosyltransferase n=1 Tax=Beggiatoa leptomitoformis TaxID=288004 RepID=A0A2N9YGP6_9GAMM|nr:glycosyltransferase family 2 protein [Beggiatoa leptomitoformis]ALG68043.1 glycosyltransferase [Beggiatoa leptomitoformis]AUI69667.1 glycosyltransferase [Beggiatoa leptomitoformis]
MYPIKPSIIITTYNRPDALQQVLHACAQQQGVDVRHLEIIIADDGSHIATTELINSLRPRLPYQLKHSWQADNGFRAGMARNRAVALATGNYLIFLDGDCLPRSDFVAQHLQLAEQNWFVAGNRVLLNPVFTEAILQQAIQLPDNLWQWWRVYLQGAMNRFLPLLTLPLPNAWRKWHCKRWQGAKTCNLAMWRADFFAVNGFDELFQGWGHEDADLVVRLIRAGVQRKEGRFAVPVFHLWHPEQDRSQEPANIARLQAILTATTTVATVGVNQYLSPPSSMA